MFLKISEYSQENACVKSLFNKVAILKISCFIKIDSNTVFFCKYREIFRARLLQNNSGGSFWTERLNLKTPKNTFRFKSSSGLSHVQGQAQFSFPCSLLFAAIKGGKSRDQKKKKGATRLKIFENI